MGGGSEFSILEGGGKQWQAGSSFLTFYSNIAVPQPRFSFLPKLQSIPRYKSVALVVKAVKWYVD